MADYEFLEPGSLDLASSRAPAGPPKPPRLHSAGDLCDVTPPPHISVTAPPEPGRSLWEPGRSPREPARPPDSVHRLKLAGSFDSLDSETMVSVGDMADLGRLRFEPGTIVMSYECEIFLKYLRVQIYQ